MSDKKRQEVFGLYWASEETVDPRFKEIAMRHADTAMANFVRPDGSVCHIAEFDPETGVFVKSYGGQGYCEGSSWTRGQTWALYGFVISYLHTGKQEYLDTARRAAQYFMANIPENGIIPVDFLQPSSPAFEDSSAAAIAASGLITIAGCVGDMESAVYENAVLKLLKILDESRCYWSKNCDCIVQNGGGFVLLDGGTYLSGTVYLKSNVCLYLTVSATLKASPEIADYGNDTHYNRYVNEKDMDRCFLYGEDANNIGIRGTGTADGSADCFPNEGSIYRPMMIRFLRCKAIRLEGVKLIDAAAWTTAFLDSEDIRVRDVDICNEKRYNGDGLDFDGCKNVFVSGCKINGTDDNLCLQASSRQYPVENIHISDCHFTSICAGIRIGLKSVGDIRGAAVTGCTFENVWREGIKIECTEGGMISDVAVTGNVMRNVRRPVFIILNNRLEEIGSSVGLTEMPCIGSLERITIDGLIAADDEEMEKTRLRFGNTLLCRIIGRNRGERDSLRVKIITQTGAGPRLWISVAWMG